MPIIPVIASFLKIPSSSIDFITQPIFYDKINFITRFSTPSHINTINTINKFIIIFNSLYDMNITNNKQQQNIIKNRIRVA